MVYKRLFTRKSILTLLVIITLGWLMVVQYQKLRTVTYVIPPGTATLLETGQETIVFPNQIRLTVGWRDTLIIENQDDVIHRFGPFIIAPQTRLVNRFSAARVYEDSCTFHPDRQMKLVVNAAPWQKLFSDSE